jgi:hypothetical protein
MKTQRFKLYDLHQKNRCVDYVKALKNSSKEPYEVIIRPYNKKNQRSIDQNNRYWHIVRAAANEIGYTANELHSIMCVQILGTNTVTNLEGEAVEVAVQTSGLSVEQFAEYMERVESVLIEAGFYNPTTMSREINQL